MATLLQIVSLLAFMSGVALWAGLNANPVSAGLDPDASGSVATCSAVTQPGTAGDGSEIRSSNVITPYLYFPFVATVQGCQVVNETYGTVAVISAPANPPAQINPDLNLGLRGYQPVSAYLGLVDYGGSTDPNAPQLSTLFTVSRLPTFSSVSQVNEWNSSCNCRGSPIADPVVTLAGLGVTNGEVIHVPGSGYDIGTRPTGYEVMVLYAGANRLTLKYTREDNVVNGYTVHLENICVDPNLLALYNSMNSAGRSRLPALYSGQGVGRALSSPLGVVIRDTGSFMDPRSRKDWWQGW